MLFLKSFSTEQFLYPLSDACYLPESFLLLFQGKPVMGTFRYLLVTPYTQGVTNRAWNGEITLEPFHQKPGR